jgi:hypothetical protein
MNPETIFALDEQHKTYAQIAANIENFSQMLSYCENHCVTKIKNRCPHSHLIVYKFSDDSSIEFVHKFNRIVGTL